LPMPLVLSKDALAIAAVVAIALNARAGPIQSKTLARRLALPERHLEPMLQAMARHGILKGTRGPLGGYELAREQRRITADEILRAAGRANKTDRTPAPQSALLNSVVIPTVEQAERTFSTALTRINIEDLAHSAAALPTQEPERGDSILTKPDSARQSRARDRRAALMVIERLLKEQYNALATPVPPHLAALVEKLKNAEIGETSGYSKSLFARR
jgi:Rrf2 family transcriptional regulator, iron-sulfur cluster assembly transcription factor